MKLWWDLETYCETPVTAGAHRYAEKAEILLFAWAVDDGPVSVWDCTAKEDVPGELWCDLQKCGEAWGHNSGMFDVPVMNKARRALLKAMPEHRDTMVQALCHGLPGKLDTLCDIFRLPADLAKDKRGRQLIQMFCKPRPANSKVRRYTRETHPKEWMEFREYAASDITAMRELHKRMPKWNYPDNENELALWQMDQRINNAGIYVDLDLAAKAIEAVDHEQAALAGRTDEATGGMVSSATQRDALLQYILAEYGVSLPDMRSDTLERRLADTELSEGVRELIGLRLLSSASSVSKFKRVLGSVSSDGFLRGTIQFSGAGRTGRDAGRLFQPQNLLRPTLAARDIETGIEAIKAGCADLITDKPIELCANAMRGVIIAPPGKKLVVADLSNIEGRVVAWLAGEEWKLQAFRDFDAGKGEDLYKVAYGRAFKTDPKTVTKQQRQIGKVMELFLAYQGGVGAFVTGASTYSIDLDTLDADIPRDVAHEAESFWEWMREQKRTLGLKKETFMMCDSLKRLWRRAHPKIEALWKRTEDAVELAVGSEGAEFRIGVCTVLRKGNWLRIILPSGRALSYPAPRVDEDGKISYMGMNQYSRKWQRISTYGGKLVENMTQAVARDVFKNCYQAVEEAGYRIVLPVHDELLTYAPDGMLYGPHHLSGLMSRVPPWAKGLPLAAAGFEAYRYRKD